jgi:alkaline phosphatase
VRFGLITDIHYADKAPVAPRYYRESIPKLQESIAQFKQARLDFVVELGDLVDAAESARDEIGYLRRIEREYEGFPAQRHYVLGNHCVWTLTKREFFDNCGARSGFYSFEHAGFHFVVLDACYRQDGVAYGQHNFDWRDSAIPRLELEWLEADLRASSGMAIIFVHQRLDVSGAYGVKNASRVRQILESSSKTLVVFQGHNHLNDLREISGIHYLTLAALVEGSGQDNNAYGTIDLHSDGAIHLTGFRQQRTYSLTKSEAEP